MERYRAEIGAAAAEAVDQVDVEQRDDDKELAELLELLQARASCGVCSEKITAFDMFVVWPVGGVVAHMACYVSGQALPRVEASS